MVLMLGVRGFSIKNCFYGPLHKEILEGNLKEYKESFLIFLHTIVSTGRGKTKENILKP